MIAAEKRARLLLLVERLRMAWRRNAARSLTPTREGRYLIAIAFAVGFAAINTGNNLLFFGWGLVLSSIVISGVLSEANLRAVRARLVSVDELRAGQMCPLRVDLENPGKRLPAFGLSVHVLLETAGATVDGSARHHLRLGPGQTDTVIVRATPVKRGVHRIADLQVRTRFPFGFFEKTRHTIEKMSRTVVVLPRRVDTGMLPDRILSRSGAIPLASAGVGDEFFALRHFREGDDPRQIVWRRSAKSGRLFVRENERVAAREVVVDVVIPPSASDVLIESIIAMAGSVAEDLMAHGVATGLAAPGAELAPGLGGRHRTAFLTALALVDVKDAPRTPALGRAARLVVTGAGHNAGRANFVVEVPDESEKAPTRQNPSTKRRQKPKASAPSTGAR
jgi:uncharacterized protein (DUF58 family)